ncbi:class I SAM-dependent DNA methyltransferase [Kitasatospora sp. NPDC092039]|uniref:class I SAM-dependent DNA methyltransferase n=1 Tax=Kitasatospora sp. NPDC092039 TaxID=3364086 RepID=UPI00381C5B24
MTYDSLVNRGDYFSAHYLAEVLPKDLKSGLLSVWKEREEAAKAATAADDAEQDPDALPVTPRAGLRALRRPYFRSRAGFAGAEAADDGQASADDDTTTYGSPAWCERVRALNARVLLALGFDAKPGTITVERADQAHQVRVAHSEKGLVALDCGWAAEPDAALDPDGSGRLLEPLVLDGQHSLVTGSKLASFLFACEDAPRYVLLLVGGVVVLADRMTWGEGRYLAVSLDGALERNDTKAGGELDTVAALFGADSLRTPEAGGENPLAELVDKSTKHAVGVSSDLRDGLRASVELIANEVLDRIRENDGVRPEDVMELPELGRQLTRESLRYLYRILFLLYAEARPELGILPADYPEYQQGYGLGRLGELVAERDLVDEKSRRGFYLYESLDLLFGKVQEGYRPRRTHGVVEEKASEDIGLRFEPLHSKLFEPESIKLIGASSVPDPRFDADETGEERYLDTRLRNATLYKVLRLLMLTKGRKGERGGFISYAQLGINQLGAVYEGLMSYNGFVSDKELYEVAKGGDPKDGSWLIPKSKVDEYPDSVFVRTRDEDTGEEVPVRHKPGSFVYRLSGRDRQTSASYYTPESLTKVTVQLTLQHRLDQDGTTTEARELLDWKICEPALGSGAFLNEAINQVAAEYLRRRQDELGVAIDTEKYPVELQKVKAYIALHNSYGVDLNETAVELAEVSLWLNTMHPGMEAPWFGLHLRRGNSLIGGRREVYPAEKLKKGGWLGTTPERFPLADAVNGVPLPEGSVHHFLLPAKEWGAVAAEKEAKALAPEAAKALGAWRRAITKSPNAKQVTRLQGLARRAEYLWSLVVRRLEISERDISRRIDVWGTEEEWLRSPEVAVQREEVLADLLAVDTPYWRLKTLMDAWCALWFWPVQEAALLDGSADRYKRVQDPPVSVAVEDGSPQVLLSWEAEDLFGGFGESGELTMQALERRRRTGRRKEAIREVRRSVIALASLDDWLDFAEALLGTHEVPAESLVSAFETLEELTPYEDGLPDLMGMDRAHWLESRFPWASVARDVAEALGFFHWELEFAQVFAVGGYDLQVGNPPWVQPDWQEALILAEIEPWFILSDNPSAEDWKTRSTKTLENDPRVVNFFLSERSANTGTTASLSSRSTYPLIEGTRTDFYRAFMCRAWNNLAASGTAGLIHPDTHFGGVKDGRIRKAAYARLKVHAGFVNGANWAFPKPVGDTTSFGIHIYGHAGRIHFDHLSHLYAAEIAVESFTHDGSGEPPGIKFQGAWDIRPHISRIINVDETRLSSWSSLTQQGATTASEAAMLHPVTIVEQPAIDAMSRFTDRIDSLEPSFTQGYNESTDRRNGIIRKILSTPSIAEEVILQPAHIAVATPFAKQPPNFGSSDRPVDLSLLPENSLWVTNFYRACEETRYTQEQDTWDGTPYTSYYRIAWRKRTPSNGERSLFASIIPPGPAHVHSVYSMKLRDLRSTSLNAGFWASLPLDYFIRIAGWGDLTPSGVRQMPAASTNHPLAGPLLLRTLRLNCLTAAYASLWHDLFDPMWPERETWATDGWENLAPLAENLTPEWGYHTPLRTEYERRAALTEMDALVAVWLGITAEQLVTIYRSRYPVLYDYEAGMYFDAKGRKIASNHNAFGHGQGKDAFSTLLDHVNDPAYISPPEGYTAPFYKADREAEMRAAHAHFQARLDAEIAAGRWTPLTPDEDGS